MHLNERARKWLPWALLAMAIIATAAAYWPGVAGGWVFDDYPNIVDNQAIHITPGHSTLVDWLNAALSSPASFLHRPLASITFAANWYFGGGNPWPFKVTNIFIHLVNGVLLFFMLKALLGLMSIPGLRCSSFRSRAVRGTWTLDFFAAASPKSQAPHSAGGSATARPGMASGHDVAINDAAATRLALVVSTAWLLLPINLMAVLYVVQRMESLCQVFVLAGLWAYLHGRWLMLTADTARRDRHGLALATVGLVVATLLGLTSKETAVLLPVFAFLAEWIVIRFSRRVATAYAAITDSTPHSTVAGSGTMNVGTPRAPDGVALPRRGEPLPQDSSENIVASGASLPPPTGREIERHARSDKRIWGLFTVTLFVPAVLGFLWLLRRALRPGALAGRDFTLGQRLLTEPRVLVDYLHWTLFPNPDVLSLYHDEIVLSTGILHPWTTLGSMLLLAALVVLAVLLRNRRPLVSLGIGWFFAAQLLTATIVPLELVYEQRMYFASIGVLMAAGTLLLGLRWRVHWPLVRGFLTAVALLWFALATNLRAQEWSNPLQLAVAEANRHPESPRAVYEAGRQLLIASDYRPGRLLDAAWKYLREASAIPGSSALSDQAMIMIADHQHQGEDAAHWATMTRKLRDQPTRQEDISALISLTNCYGAGICKFDVSNLNRAYEAALSRPHPIARLYGAFADFQRDLLHNDKLAEVYLERAVADDPRESAYRADLAALYARNRQTEKAMEQISALRRMNLAGRLDGQIERLERLAEQGKDTLRRE